MVLIFFGLSRIILIWFQAPEPLCALCPQTSQTSVFNILSKDDVSGDPSGNIITKAPSSFIRAISPIYFSRLASNTSSSSCIPINSHGFSSSKSLFVIDISMSSIFFFASFIAIVFASNLERISIRLVELLM